jgi:hypothetical protein
VVVLERVFGMRDLVVACVVDLLAQEVLECWRGGGRVRRGGAHETVQIVEDFDRADAVRAPVCEGDGS